MNKMFFNKMLYYFIIAFNALSPFHKWRLRDSSVGQRVEAINFLKFESDCSLLVNLLKFKIGKGLGRSEGSKMKRSNFTLIR